MKLSLNELKSFVAYFVQENKISVETFTETRNNSVGLLDTLGKIYANWQNYGDKLDIFDGEDLAFGKTIEEWAQDLILPVEYDANGSTTLAPHDSTYRPASFSYTLGRMVIPQTIRYNDVERAVHNIAQFDDIITGKTKAMYDSETLLRYQLKRQALGVLISRCMATTSSSGANLTLANTTTTITGAHSVNERFWVTSESASYVVVKPMASNLGYSIAAALDAGYVIKYNLVTTLAKPVDTATGEAFIKQVQTDIEVASDVSEGHSLNGNTLGGNNEAGLVLVMLQGINPVLKVDTYAGAFNKDQLALPATEKTIIDFGTASNNVYAILVDARIMRLHNTYRAVREQENGQGDFLNMYYHTENTAHISRNVFVKVYKTE